MFVFVLVFATSVTFFICVVVTLQQQRHHRRTVSSVAVTATDRPRRLAKDAKAARFTPPFRHESRLHLEDLFRPLQQQQQQQSKAPAAAAAAQSIRVPGTGTQRQQASYFRLDSSFPFPPKNNNNLSRAFETDRKSTLAFREAVQRAVGCDRTVFLSTVDTAYVTMAANLYMTSFSPFNINYLFVGTDRGACRLLRVQVPAVACVTYFADADGNKSSNWGSANFRRKTHYKTKIILEALRMGLTVVIVDLDIVFFRNPLPFMTCVSCDVQIQSDVYEGNSGFYMARPTNASVELHDRAMRLGATNPRLSNQKALGQTIGVMRRRRRIRLSTLDRKQFPCGVKYYEDMGVMFAGDVTCDDCVIVHNNWIVSQEAKIYRFKETGMWQVDAGGYYTDPDRKYLAYGNPLDFGRDATLGEERDALRAALFLGALLNRTVILPAFHCHGCGYGACKNRERRCALNTFFRIASFDQEFSGLYREHVFLLHAKVPDSVKRNQSGEVLVCSGCLPSMIVGPKVQVLLASNTTSGPTEDELLAWFNTGSLADFAVLRFHSLYGMFRSVELILASSHVQDWHKEFAKRLSRGLKRTDYRQY